MENSIQMQLAGTIAVKNLRRNKLQNGQPFMINSNDLPGNQCFIEYPDATIKLVTISGSGLDFVVIRVLSENESIALRQKYNLSDA
jgi:hypothetical protein